MKQRAGDRRYIKRKSKEAMAMHGNKIETSKTKNKKNPLLSKMKNNQIASQPKLKYYKKKTLKWSFTDRNSQD